MGSVSFMGCLLVVSLRGFRIRIGGTARQRDAENARRAGFDRGPEFGPPLRIRGTRVLNVEFRWSALDASLNDLGLFVWMHIWFNERVSHRVPAFSPRPDRSRRIR